MGQITIRFAEEADRASILAFISDHWRADHVFVKEPHVFDWQYRSPDGGYNIAIAVDNGELLGVLGFIPTGRFDPTLGFREIMLAIWKVRDDKGPPSLGLGLLKLIERTYSPEVIGAVGISAMVVPIYKAFRYTVGTLSHVALIPKREAEYRIAGGVRAEAIFEEETKQNYTISPMLTEVSAEAKRQICALSESAPGLRKSWDYLVERYFQHPWYQYQVGIVESNGVAKAAFVWRRVEANSSAVLRIVDVLGTASTIADAASDLASIVTQEGAEYIDLVANGIDTDKFRAAGFASPDWNEGLVLPNYFSPFEARNVEIKFAYKAARSLCLFRADSDQDRPNSMSDLMQKA